MYGALVGGCIQRNPLTRMTWNIAQLVLDNMSKPRASEVEVCRGSDTPTIYVGDIDMYIPLENLIASHANCMQHVSAGKCNLTAQNTRKPFGCRGFASDPAEGAYSAPANPLAGGEGQAVPFPRTPSPVLGLSGLACLTPTPKLVPTPLVKA